MIARATEKPSQGKKQAKGMMLNYDVTLIASLLFQATSGSLC